MITVLGGDKRQKELAKLLNANFNTLYLDGSNDFSEIKNYISLSKAVVFPYPFSRDKITISTTKYDILKIKEALRQDCVVFGGGILNFFENKTIDYAKDENFLLKNALYTAEGATLIAKQNTNYSLSDLNILIVGNGRIGKYLSKILSAYCEKITVSARKQSDFDYLKTRSLKYFHTNKQENLSEFDLIFNTVNQKALNDIAIKSIKNDVLIIDLASKNSGLFKEQNYIDAKALPTKFCALSSAKAIYNIICNTLKKRWLIWIM